MISSLPVLLVALFISSLSSTPVSAHRQLSKSRDRARQAEAERGFRTRVNHRRSDGVQNITFSNPKASEFWVNGTAIPEVDWDVGPSWAGLLPISGKPDETRKLFFWFFPPGPEGDLDILNIWTNGGPGCSSLEGMLQENGMSPITWSWGQARPTVNEFSWTNLSSILYVEQPVGTGFSQGTPNIHDEHELAEQFTGFLHQFLEVFCELKGKKTYLTGESYAGKYIPYIADYIYSNPTAVDLSLRGTWLADPVLSWDVTQTEIPVVPFVQKYQHVFAFNHSFMSYLEKTAVDCNYAGYLNKHLKYPPHGLLPLPGTSIEADTGCDLWNDTFNAAVLINPAFNIYRIFDTYPILWDVLGFPGSFPQTQVSPLYFDREDVKKAIHAPLDVTWAECADEVFVGGVDKSLPPAFTVLPGVIEKNERSVIIHGLADFVLIAEGTRLVIQNMTWNDKQGFHHHPKADSLIVEGMGAMGTVQSERGLTYYEVALSGHMIPQFSPKAAFQSVQYLMGLRDTP